MAEGDRVSSSPFLPPRDEELSYNPKAIFFSFKKHLEAKLLNPRIIKELLRHKCLQLNHGAQ